MPLASVSRPDPQPPAAPRRAWAGPTVIALAAVSLLTDAASEMIYPLLPLYLTTVLGASAVAVGAVEGTAESVAALVKLASGWWSDRVRRRKPLVVAGYLIATIARPLVAFAGSSAQVLAIRSADRVGKGIRSAPRDALLAEAVPPAQRGRAFGLHRAADHLGAVIGPLLAALLLGAAGLELRHVFLLAAVPGALAVLVLVAGVRERARPVAAVAPARTEPAASPPARADRAFPLYLAALALFTLGNATDAFLLLRAQSLGVPVAAIPLLWAALHVAKSATSVPGGALADRVGCRPAIVAGWAIYAVSYLLLARARTAQEVWAIVLLYGVHFGLVEGPERALVSELAPVGRGGTAFGWYHAVVGVLALPASLLFGWLWTAFGAAVAFRTGAALAAAAALLLLFVRPSRARAAVPPGGVGR